MNTSRRRIVTLLACLTLWAIAGVLAGADPGAPGRQRDRGRFRRAAPNGKNESAVKAAFQETLQQASTATVRLLVDGEEAALGAVVDADGYLISKASVLGGKITCCFKDGTQRQAKIVGTDSNTDLALLQVDAVGLPIITWRDGGLPPPGSLVATSGPANEPVAIGVVSADLRRIRALRGPRLPQAWLGIGWGTGDSGLGIETVVPRSPAAKAGVRVGDVVAQIDGTAVQSVQQIIQTVASHSPGQSIKLLVHRNNEDVEIPATLARLPELPGPQDDWGGGPFSERRWGFAAVLPHDTPLLPKDCGGPLVDTDGRAVGINIARALRVTTYALPASVVKEVVAQLKPKPQEAKTK